MSGSEQGLGQTFWNFMGYSSSGQPQGEAASGALNGAVEAAQARARAEQARVEAEHILLRGRGAEALQGMQTQLDPANQTHAAFLSQFQGVVNAVGTERIGGHLESCSRGLNDMLEQMRTEHAWRVENENTKIASAARKSDRETEEKRENRVYQQGELAKLRRSYGKMQTADTLRQYFRDLFVEVIAQNKLREAKGAQMLGGDAGDPAALRYASSYSVKTLRGWAHNKRKITASMLPIWNTRAQVLTERYQDSYDTLDTLFQDILGPVSPDHTGGFPDPVAIPAWDLKMKTVEDSVKKLETIMDEINKLMLDIREKSSTSNCASVGKIAIWIGFVTAFISGASAARAIFGMVHS